MLITHNQLQRWFFSFLLSWHKVDIPQTLLLPIRSPKVTAATPIMMNDAGHRFFHRKPSGMHTWWPFQILIGDLLPTIFAHLIWDCSGNSSSVEQRMKWQLRMTFQCTSKVRMTTQLRKKNMWRVPHNISKWPHGMIAVSKAMIEWIIYTRMYGMI